MSEQHDIEAARKNQQELNRVMKKFIFWGSIKLLVLAAISAGFVYWYMYS
jgi:FtsH-binding integral membrane protein